MISLTTKRPTTRPELMTMTMVSTPDRHHNERRANVRERESFLFQIPA